ncbi:exodeoxyribonuclease V subunit gamma, partial [Kingella kingae]
SRGLGDVYKRQPLSSPIACQHIRRSLDEPTDAGLLRGGITFCSMVPMRSLPFKMLCLLGLNDGTFPRNTKAAPFDLIAKQPRKGDRSRRDDDRYLFLEAILSAREQLYLSYIGRDIRSDAERAPSTLLSELVDTISALSDVPSSDLYQHWVTHHPLQAFSRRYFASAEQDNPHLSSTRSDFAHALNLAQQGQTHQAKNFVDWRNTDNDPATLIRQKDFLRFWRNPVRHWLHHTLNWQSPYFSGNHKSEEPFLSDQPRRLDDAYVQARMHNQSFDDTASYLRAQSLLPAGELGKQEAKSYEIAAKALDTNLLNSPRLPHRSGELACGQGSLHFDLSHNHEAGQILLARDFLSDNNTHGKLTSPDQVQLLLQHLIYCAATPDHEPVARQTHYVSLTQQMSLPPMSQAQAQAALSVWLAYYAQGQQAPLPYFARVNWAAAMALYTKKDANWLAAQDAAADKYHAGYFGMAQEDYPEVQLVFGRDPDAEPPYTLPEFQQITEDLFEPLQVCLQAFADNKDKK